MNGSCGVICPRCGRGFCRGPMGHTNEHRCWDCGSTWMSKGPSKSNNGAGPSSSSKPNGKSSKAF